MEWLEGAGLHTGAPSRVGLRRGVGPVRLSWGGVEATVDELEVVSTARATTVQARAGGLRLGTVEHFLAALAGLGLYEGVAVEVEGPELPMLDGGASVWCAALRRLDAAPSPPRLRVTRPASFDVGPSHYELAPTDGALEVTARIDFDDPRLAPEASWAGDAADFVARIAPARTFALARDLDELARRGLARHVDPACVVVITPDAILHAGRPFAADEPARHKLLDLLGDLYLRGGPPVGRLTATRPGHAANARFLQRAVEDGVLAHSSTMSKGR
ncbi:MAG TPA: UDP-3-O-acyl-N-acetylglucosamine deacetylase [Polyangiaceae bacterium]